MRFLLAIACVASTTDASCADFMDDCAGCLTHRFGVLRPKCNFCMRAAEKNEDNELVAIVKGRCTSKPAQKCKPEDGYHVMKPGGTEHTQQCNALQRVLMEQAEATVVAKTAKKDDELMSKVGSRKGLHYGDEFKLGTSKLFTEKVGTVVRMSDGTMKRLHLGSNARKYWLKDQYTNGYKSVLGTLMKLPQHRILSRATFLGKAYELCRDAHRRNLNDNDNEEWKSLMDRLNQAIRPDLPRKLANRVFTHLPYDLRFGDWKLFKIGHMKLFKIGHMKALKRYCLNLGAGGVKYLAKREREDYEYELNDAGELVKKIDRNEKLDTCGMRTEERGKGWAIFVVEPETFKMYSHSHTLDRFHHSSFLRRACHGGGRVAGQEWKDPRDHRQDWALPHWRGPPRPVHPASAHGPQGVARRFQGDWHRRRDGGPLETKVSRT